VKTKRTKRRNPKGPLYSQNISVHVVAPGEQVRLAGGARKDEPVRHDSKSKPVFLGRTYTGVNRGKAYPYAGKKRGGSGGLTLHKGKTVHVLDGAEASPRLA
jgi:hypothetical protein